MKEKTRRKYDAEFKRNAVVLANEPGKTDIQSLGIPHGLIYRWRKQLEKKEKLHFQVMVEKLSYQTRKE